MNKSITNVLIVMHQPGDSGSSTADSRYDSSTSGVVQYTQRAYATLAEIKGHAQNSALSVRRVIGNFVGWGYAEGFMKETKADNRRPESLNPVLSFSMQQTASSTIYSHSN